MIFQEGELTIRYVTENDVRTLSNWLSSPEALRFYPALTGSKTPTSRFREKRGRNCP
ncbi:hypothetical protein SAMN04488574_104350 [Bacillus sp. 71mf]|nr:hypothetical protein SAMN04488574_104350 [Bacillus sp. 71mf]SFS84478.1 hypothetical protein SAMN04488145_10416 [Bacillus sp. 103mf]